MKKIHLDNIQDVDLSAFAALHGGVEGHVRKLTNAEAFKHMTNFRVARDKTTTPKGGKLTANILAGVDTFILAAAPAPVAPVAGDMMRLGDEYKEIVYVEAYNGTTREVTLVSKTEFAHSAGEGLVEQTAFKPGDLSEDGVMFNVETDYTDVRSATRRGVWYRNINNSTETGSASVLNISPENMLMSLGIPETDIHGAGTAADPYVVDLAMEKINTQGWQAFLFDGYMNDSSFVHGEFWDVQMAPNLQMTFRSGETVTVPLEWTAQHIRVTFYA